MSNTNPLQHKNQLLTRQRRLVLEILQQSPQHPDAGMIYLEAKKRGERISLATVYRSLGFLKEAGLVEENSFGEGHGHFEPAQGSHHFHFTCIDCGAVIELEAAEINKLALAMSESRGLQVTEIQILLRGYCPDCRQKHTQAAD